MQVSHIGLGVALAFVASACGPKRPPLTAAIVEQQDERAVALLRAQSTPNDRIECESESAGWTPLLCAVTEAISRPPERRSALVVAFLEAGADPNIPGPDGRTPLLYACRSGDPEIITALLAHGADAKARVPSMGDFDARLDCQGLIAKHHGTRINRFKGVLALLRERGIDTSEASEVVAQRARDSEPRREQPKQDRPRCNRPANARTTMTVPRTPQECAAAGMCENPQYRSWQQQRNELQARLQAVQSALGRAGEPQVETESVTTQGSYRSSDDFKAGRGGTTTVNTYQRETGASAGRRAAAAYEQRELQEKEADIIAKIGALPPPPSVCIF